MSRQFTRDFFLGVKEGKYPGYSAIEKFGHNGDIDTGTTPEDVWDGGGLWVPPTAARTHDIVSTVAADVGVVRASGTATGGSTTTLVDSGATFTLSVSAGDVVINDTTVEHSVVVSVTDTTLTTEPTRHSGVLASSGDSYRVVDATSTGASIVHIKSGLDSDFTPQQEFIVMNGTTDVPTVNTYYRIDRMHLDAAASGSASNVGTITATAQTDATVTCQIDPAEGQTLMAIYTIPKGVTAYLYRLWGSLGRKGSSADALVDCQLWVTPHARSGKSGGRVAYPLNMNARGNSFMEQAFKTAPKFEHETDLVVRCIYTSDSNIKISAGFDLILVDD